MKRKICALILFLSLILCIAGCNARGGKKTGVEGVMEEYVTSIRRFETDKIISLSAWKESDPEYEELLSCFVFDGYASYIQEVFDETAATISLDYKSSDIKSDGDTASINVVYTVVDWKPIFEKSHESSRDVVKDIKKSRNRNRIEGTLEFKNIDGNWKITKITSLDKVMDFTNAWPRLENKEWPTRPPMN